MEPNTCSAHWSSQLNRSFRVYKVHFSVRLMNQLLARIDFVSQPPWHDKQLCSYISHLKIPFAVLVDEVFSYLYPCLSKPRTKSFYSSLNSNPKPSLKIRTASAIFWIYLSITAWKTFFRNKTLFVFQDRKLKCVWDLIFWILAKFQLIQFIQTIVISIFAIGCLIELKFCEVS